MELGTAQVAQYEREGHVLLEALFSADECAVLRAEARSLAGEHDERRILELDGQAVRSVYDAHRRSATFARLVADRRVLDPAREVVGGDVYIHQTQLNPKAAFEGEHWDWHQDFLYWQRDDGMPSPRAVNVVVYLDEMSVFNGPLFVVPGSHRETYDAATATVAGGWERTLTRDMKHVLDRAALRRAVEAHGMAAPLGPAGSVLLFDPRILHASPGNISPLERTALFIRYNDVRNALAPVAAPRPAWLAERSPAAVEPLDGGFLDVPV